MPRTGSRQDFDHFDDWETFDVEEDIYANAEKDLVDDWEDDGSIAQVREPVAKKKVAKPKKARDSSAGPQNDNVVTQNDDVVTQNEDVLSQNDRELEVDSASAEVFSLLERSQSKNAKELLDLGDPSEDELSRIEEVGIDDYIDSVLGQEPQPVINEELESIEIEQENQLMDERTLEHGSEVAIDSPPIMSFGEEDIDLVVQPLFEGIAIALPTLFDEEGEVEYKTTARLAKRLISENVSAIFIGTAEGEGNTLSRKERKTLVKTVSKSSDVLVCVDVTSPSIRQSIQIANDSIDAGAKSLLVTIDANVRDPYSLCESLYENNRDIPLIVRLAGEPLSIPISPEFLYDLPIAGVIDATGDVSFFLHLISAYGGPVYIGKSEMILTGHAMGAVGVVLPEVAVSADLVSKAFSGDPSAQAEIAMWKRETGDTQVRAIKIALEADFLVSSNMRD